MKKLFYWFMFIILYLPLRIIFPVKIVGRKKGKFKGRKIYISNHLHAMDPFMMVILFGIRARPLAKKELFKTKFGAALMNGLGIISINRGQADISATKKVLEALKRGESLVIFPEGTRNRMNVEDQLEIKNGAGMFAIKTKTPMVPCCFLNRLKPFRPTKFIVGNPYELSEFYDQKLSAEILDKAGEQIGRSITQVREEYKALIYEKKNKK
ncbi:MAG: 1-acyl-sn-glycerol-3-phosphate acyltransferase [Christensenellaceae bacterium]|jgi:1-acyl-sn-glycerol-3-phosphate acyltransferase|nr:1-acyl-sn-glycerol-3-phosphate acyltransferase [Christensenellaceae bacterium]